MEQLPIHFDVVSRQIGLRAQFVDDCTVDGDAPFLDELLGMAPGDAEKALSAARRTSKERLLSGMAALQRADDRLKSSKDPRTVMEFLVSEIAGGGMAAAG